MKRGILVCLLVAVAAFSAFALSACGGKRSKGGAKDVLRITSFETYDELTEMRWLNSFGAAKLSDEHVTHGEKSLHVTAMGKAGEAAKPTLCIETGTDRLKKNDFTDVYKFTLDVYNDNDYEANVYFQYLTAAAEQNKISGALKASVPAKSQKTVEFAIDRALSSYFLNLDEVLQLRISFDPIAEAGEAYRSFYIDNLRGYTTSEKFTPSNPRKADEIESADRAEYVAAWGNILQYVYSPSSLTFNDDPQFVKAGGGSFKLMSERTDGSKEEPYTVGIKCVNNKLAVSDYAAVGYWAYNPGDTDLDAYVQVDKTQIAMGKLPKNEWKYFEIEKSLLDKLPFETSFEGLSIEFNVPTDKKYTVYIDEVYALKDNLIPVITVDDVTETYTEAGVTVRVPAATVQYADGYTVKVFGPDNELLCEDEQSFVAQVCGTYTVEYSATARRADADGNKAEVKERIQIVVGEVPEFVSVPKDMFVATEGEYTLKEIATSEDGAVTWRAEILNLFSFQAPGTFNDTATSEDKQLCVNGIIEQNAENKVYVFRNSATRITYTVTNGQGISAQAQQTLVNYNDYRKLTELYPGLYENATVTDDLTKLSAEDDVLGDKGGLRLRNAGGGASGKFTPDSVDLGASNKNLRFVIFNNGTKPATFFINDNDGSTIAPKTYMVFDGIRFEYAALQAWNIIGKDDMRSLLPLTFRAESAAAVDLSIGCFTVNADTLTPVVTPDYEATYAAGDKIDVSERVSVAGADTFSYSIYRRVTQSEAYGDAIVSGDASGETEYTFTQAGYYKVEYTVEYTDGTTKTVTAYAEFRVISREISFDTKPQDAFAPSGDITVTAPTSKDGTVSWKIEILQVLSYYNDANSIVGALDTAYGEHGFTGGVLGNSPASFYLPANRAARIEYTLTDKDDAANTAVVYQTYVNFTDCTKLSQFYPELYTGATLTGLVPSTDFDIFGAAGETMRLRGTGDFIFAPPANTYLGDSNENIRFVVYNNGTKATTFRSYVYGNSFIVSPGCYAVYAAKDKYTYDAAIKGWKTVDEHGNLNTLQFFVATDGAETDLYIGYFTVNEGSFVPKPAFSCESRYEKGASLNVGDIISGGYTYDYTISRSATESGEYTSVQTGKSTDPDLNYTLTQSGWYKIQYDISYSAGATTATLTKTVSFQVVNKPIVFSGVPASGVVAMGQSHDIPVPTAKSGDDDCTVTWRAELLRAISTRSGDEAPGKPYPINTDGWVGNVMEGDPASFYMINDLAAAVRITYTATDADGFTATAVTTYVGYAADPGEKLSEIYPDFYSGASVTGDVQIVSDDTDGLLFGDGAGLKMTGDKSANGTFTRNVKIGGRPNTVMRYVAYNNGDQDVTLQVGRADNAVALSAKSAYVFCASAAYQDAALQGWGFIDNATDRILQTLNITATSTGAIDIRINCFTVESGAFEPAVTVSVASSYISGVQVDFGTTITGASTFTYSLKKGDAVVASGNQTEHAAVSLGAGSYEIAYIVPYTKGEQTLQKTVTKTFEVTAFTVDLGAQAVKRIDIATYSIAENLPAVPDGAEITAWTVKAAPVSYLYGNKQFRDIDPTEWPQYDENDTEKARMKAFSPLENYAYRIEYTVACGSETLQVMQWLLPEKGTALETVHPEVFADGKYGCELGTSLTIGGNRAATDKALVATGDGSVGFNFKPAVDIGSDAKGLVFWVMVDSQADTANVALGKNGNEAGPVSVPTGVWVRVVLDWTEHIKAWGMVDANNVFQELGMRVSGTGATTVYVDAFAVHQ